MLGHDVHGHLGQVEIGADPGCGGDPCDLKNLLYQLFRQLPGSKLVGVQVRGGIDEDLVDGIYVDIIRGNIL